MIRKTIVLLAILLGVMTLALAINPTTQTQADTSHVLRKHTFSNGGGLLEGSQFNLQAVVGQPSVVGELKGSNLTLNAGYLAGSLFEEENASPVANAGEDQTVKVKSLVTLDGSASYDPDGHLPLTYLWTQVSGDPVELGDETAEQPTFTAPDMADQLVFELSVTDTLGVTSIQKDEVFIFVEPNHIYLPLVVR